MCGYTLVRIAPLTSRAYGNFNPGVGMLLSCVERKFSLKSRGYFLSYPDEERYRVIYSYFLEFYRLLVRDRAQIDKVLYP